VGSGAPEPVPQSGVSPLRTLHALFAAQGKKKSKKTLVSSLARYVLASWRWPAPRRRRTTPRRAPRRSPGRARDGTRGVRQLHRAVPGEDRSITCVFKMASPTRRPRWAPWRLAPASTGTRRAQFCCAQRVELQPRDCMPGLRRSAACCHWNGGVHVAANDVEAMTAWPLNRVGFRPQAARPRRALSLPVLRLLAWRARFSSGSGRGASLSTAKDGSPGGQPRVVTLNYRLGVFGVFSPRRAQPRIRLSTPPATNGLLDSDQRAREWVEAQTAAAFGGDPGNVDRGRAVGGRSSRCTTLTDSHRSRRGCFRRPSPRACPGDTTQRSSPSRAEAEAQGREFAAGASLSLLRALSAMPCSRSTARAALAFRPVVDGWVNPRPAPGPGGARRSRRRARCSPASRRRGVALSHPDCMAG
jgi:hypothetical protein